MLLSIAIPDSLFVDESTLRDKTIKTGSIARTASIFGVSRIYIYRDATRNYERDYETAKIILQYAETPQYLRKLVFPKNPNLEFAGLIPPLRTPHHVKSPNPVKGEVREAFLITQSGRIFADIGSREPAIFDGRGQPGERVTVRVESQKPLKVVPADRPVDTYWGYEVRRAPTLARFLRSANFDLSILTSRKGELITEKWKETEQRTKQSERLCLSFGSPESGVDKMLSQDSATFEDFPKALVLNTFPFQNVETVRLEEALLGTLSIFNVIKGL